MCSNLAAPPIHACVGLFWCLMESGSSDVVTCDMRGRWNCLASLFDMERNAFGRIDLVFVMKLVKPTHATHAMTYCNTTQQQQHCRRTTPHCSRRPTPPGREPWRARRPSPSWPPRASPWTPSRTFGPWSTPTPKPRLWTRANSTMPSGSFSSIRTGSVRPMPR